VYLPGFSDAPEDLDKLVAFSKQQPTLKVRRCGWEGTSKQERSAKASAVNQQSQWWGGSPASADVITWTAATGGRGWKRAGIIFAPYEIMQFAQQALLLKRGQELVKQRAVSV
jgi:hypothetical protein